MKVKIYVLIDPISFKVRYIGRTKGSLSNRLSRHICDAKYQKYYRNTHKVCWIKSLLVLNKRPIIRQVIEVEGWENSHKIERSLIEKTLKIRNLVNHSDLGPGKLNTLSQLSRDKISNTLKEYYKTNENPVSKKVDVFTKEGIYITSYPSIRKCSIDLKITSSKIIEVIKGKYKQWKGMTFKYA